MKKTFISIVGGITLLTTAALASAQPDIDMESLHQSGGVMAHFSEQLGLTELQESDIATLFEEAHSATAEDKARLEELQETMHTLVEDFDDAQALENSLEMGEISGRLAYQRTLTRAGVYALLTDEQRVVLEMISADREERRGQRGKHRHGGSPDA